MEKPILSQIDIKSQDSKQDLGVYTVENPQTPEAAAMRLAITQNICLHNSQVCSDCMESEG